VSLILYRSNSKAVPQWAAFLFVFLSFLRRQESLCKKPFFLGDSRLRGNDGIKKKLIIKKLNINH
jgi:hypothetical protein